MTGLTSILGNQNFNTLEHFETIVFSKIDLGALLFTVKSKESSLQPNDKSKSTLQFGTLARSQSETIISIAIQIYVDRKLFSTLNFGYP